LLETDRDHYLLNEGKEQELREFLGKDVAILRRRREGEDRSLTLKELREEIEAGATQVDMFDLGGCGCFVDESGDGER
jgi:hypothetical protein